MTREITIRTATDADFELLIRMLVDMHGEIGIFTLSIDKVAERIRKVLQSGACLIAEVAGEPVGTIGLLGERTWYSDDYLLSDTWIFVRREKRGLRVFGELVKAARTVASNLRMPLVICLYSLKDQDRKARLFERYANRIMTGFLFRDAGGDFVAKEA